VGYAIGYDGKNIADGQVVKNALTAFCLSVKLAVQFRPVDVGCRRQTCKHDADCIVRHWTNESVHEIIFPRRCAADSLCRWWGFSCVFLQR